jgi:hypothetical protein
MILTRLCYRNVKKFISSVWLEGIRMTPVLFQTSFEDGNLQRCTTGMQLEYNRVVNLQRQPSRRQTLAGFLPR